MTSRAVFALAAGTALAVLLFVAVVRPAVERGGWGELAAIAAAFALVLIGERWLRSR